jgi:hypothetical protein
MATGAGTGNVFDPSNAGYPLLVQQCNKLDLTAVCTPLVHVNLALAQRLHRANVLAPAANDLSSRRVRNEEVDRLQLGLVHDRLLDQDLKN